MVMIPRRDVKMDFDPARVPHDWCSKDPYDTTFLGALSLLFPEGEKFFVEAVKQQRHLITDPELLKEIAGFIGQEAMHGKEHRAFNELLLAHGHTEAPLIEKRLRAFLKWVSKRVLSPMSQLAATTALEHFTAMLAEATLRDSRMRDEIDETVRPLWLWHSLEENEHKAVCYDVYKAAGGGYTRRVLIMVLTTIVFFAVQALVHARLMATRKILWKPWKWARGVTRFWIYPGYFIRLVPAYFQYFRPGFHPNDRDTNELLATWRTTLFGDGGMVALRRAS